MPPAQHEQTVFGLSGGGESNLTAARTKVRSTGPRSTGGGARSGTSPCTDARRHRTGGSTRPHSRCTAASTRSERRACRDTCTASAARQRADASAA